MSCSARVLPVTCDSAVEGFSVVQVEAIKNTLSNDEQKVGADIVRRSLGYPLKLIANNAGVNGSVVQQKVLDSADPNVGYNASTGQHECIHIVCVFVSC